MTSPTRLRVVTPERLDALVANLVNTGTSATGTAVANKAGSGTPTTTGVVTATANSLMQRDASGRSQIANPSVGADIANKSYVDTAIGTTVLSSTRGVASGVATLDGSGFIPTTQIGSTIPRNLGSGTSFPTTHNVGDFYTHTGLGCMFRWDGAFWQQAGRAVVANRAARNTMLTNWGAAMPIGFQVTQTDYRWIWRYDQGGWIYAGFEGAASVQSTTGNLGPVFKYVTTNQAFPHNYSGNTYPVANWTFQQAGSVDTEREIVTVTTNGASNNQFTFRDRCLVSLNGYATSDVGYEGRSTVGLLTPGGATGMPGGGIFNTTQRDDSYGYAGFLDQNINWTGYADANETLQMVLFNYNAGSVTAYYNCSLTITLLPV